MDSSGLCPLHHAAIANQVECARHLVDKYECQINSLDGATGRTSMHFASMFGLVDMVKFLLSRPDIHLVDLLFIFRF